jgi:hypothetical protein
VHQLGPARAQVDPDGCYGLAADRDEPFLGALAHRAHDPMFEVDVGDIE